MQVGRGRLLVTKLSGS